MNRFSQLGINSTRITDGFWGDYQGKVSKTVIPHIWKALNDKLDGEQLSRAVRNFRIAAGKEDGEFWGLVSQDSDVAKWIEAASYSLVHLNNEELKRDLDEITLLFKNAQTEDGYLNTYYIINGLENRWTYLKEGCELYCAGHIIEAAVAHFEVTGQEELLDIACKYADHIDSTFGREDGKLKGYCGHAEIELALVRLFRVTNHTKYLELAKYFIEERGRKPYYFDSEKGISSNESLNENLVYALNETNYRHSQSHLPIRSQEDADGHAVKAMYFYSAVADLAYEYKDESLLEPLYKLWESVTQRRMYITGGIGSSAEGEQFTFDFDLPNNRIYGETCASIGLFFWAFRMLRLDLNSRYSDVMEKALYNGVLSGMSKSGTQFFYTNPLEVWPEACEKRDDLQHIETKRRGWYECPCCPPNIARLIGSLGQYLYTYDEQQINVHLYVSSEASFNLNKGSISVKQESQMPYQGLVKLTVESMDALDMTLCLRVPDWANDCTVSINGNTLTSYRKENGYIKISNTWKSDVIELSFPMEVHKVHSHPKVRYNAGKVALQRGPLVYCLEENDNGECLSELSLDRDTVFNESYSDGELDGVVRLSANGTRSNYQSEKLYSFDAGDRKSVQIHAIPYYLWGNRVPGEMTVWINVDGK